MRQRLGHGAGPGMVGKTLAEPAAVGRGESVLPRSHL